MSFWSKAKKPKTPLTLVREIARPANLLRHLLVRRRRLRQRADRQTEVVAVVRRIPVPESPRRRRRQRAGTHLDVDVGRGAAHLVAGLPRRVVIDEAVERIAARRLVAEVGDDRLELPVRRALRRHGAGEHLRVALRLLIRVVEHERDVHALVRRHEQLRAQADVVEVVDLFLRRDVVEHPVALRARQRHAAGHLVAERTRDRALGLHEVVVAVAELEVVFGGEARLARRHEDRAGRRVLAEQRALRPAQHLDALDVDEVERRRRRPRVQHAVDVVADAGLDAVVRETERRAEAADVDARVARIRRIELDRRDQLLDAVDVERARFGDELAVDDRHRNRHLLHGLFAPARAGNRNHVVDVRLRSLARRLSGDG